MRRLLNLMRFHNNHVDWRLSAEAKAMLPTYLAKAADETL
jgi:hypothetical protein